MAGNHSADSFDGGRAPSEPDHAGSMSELGWLVPPRAEPEDDDTRALALAVIALTGAGG
jgi:hypothetical protein